MADPARIMIVDDLPLNLKVLSSILEGRGYSVLAFNSGVTALLAARDDPPDLILLDIEMPGMNGFAVCKQLRMSAILEHIPVIFISAHHEPSDIVTAFAVGGVDYITKPFQVDELNARVETHLKLRRLQTQLEEANAQLAAVNRRMSRDLQAASIIQRTFVLHEKPKVSTIDFAWAYEPCDELGGDGLNIIPFADDEFGLYVLDVSGHGVAPALLSVAMSRILLSGSQTIRPTFSSDIRIPETQSLPPAEVAARLHQFFPFDEASHQFTTMVYGVLAAGTGEFRYILAGHPSPIRLSTTAAPIFVETSGFPIGLGDGVYQEHTLQLLKNDRLYLYSDAVLETINQYGEPFGKARLLDVIARCRPIPLQESIDVLLKEVIEWNGSPILRDDASVLAVEYLGN